jgi:hypothetical protein
MATDSDLSVRRLSFRERQYALKADFDEWIDAVPAREPQNYNAAFYGFVKQHHERNRSQAHR